MYKLISVHARNLGSFKKLDYEVKQGVTTLTFGNNLDNESQKSNGSGKSMLIEAVSIGITGDTLRKINVDEIINNEEEEASVKLVFNNDSEVFEIDRQIFRKGASIVNCRIIRGGVLVGTDEAVKPSVAEYNRYILETIGVSKEELFNHFILSKHKYKDFLSSSDKDKKETINKFSNGILVDQAIERLLEDKAPVEAELRALEMRESNFNSKISVLKEQIKKEEGDKDNRKQTVEEKVKSIKSQIAEKRSLLSETVDSIKAEELKLVSVKDADSKIQALEEERTENHKTAVDLHLEIKEILAQVGQNKLKDWPSTIASLQSQINEISKEQETIQSQGSVEVGKMEALKLSVADAKAGLDAFLMEEVDKVSEINTAIAETKQRIDEVTKFGKSLRETKLKLSELIEKIENNLKKSITCPKCSHEFVVSDKDFDVESGKVELETSKTKAKDIDNEMIEKRKELVELNQSQERIESKIRDIDSTKKSLLRKLDDATYQLTESESKIKRLQRTIDSKSQEINSICLRIDGIKKEMFDEAFTVIDNLYESVEGKIKSLNSSQETIKGNIESLLESIDMMIESASSDLTKSLKEALEKNELELTEVESLRKEKELEFNEFVAQEARFVEFKTYLANTKIEALGKVTNEFLENIGSDIRIKFSGYTVLKSGKVRDKISISLIRDGVDMGSFGKFSAGEQARVNLATILAMQKLVNANCGIGKGLDLLILDEVLDSSDELGLSSMFEALNSLGITSIAVSHGNIAENYPHKLIVTKINGESSIDETNK